MSGKLLRQLSWFAVLFLAGTPSVFAGSLNFDFRGDYLSQHVNDEAARANLGRDYTKFTINNVRLDYKGELNSDVSFRMRFKFTDTAAAKTQRDNTTAMLDLAFLTYKFNDTVALSMGKIATDIAGVEGQTSSPDLYLTSQAYADTSAERYQTGLKLAVTAVESELNLYALNMAADVPTGATSTTYEQNRNTLGLGLKSKALSQYFQPVLGYYWGEYQATPNNRKDSFMNVGFRSDLGAGFVFEYDYLLHKHSDRYIGGPVDTLETNVASLSYTWNEWTPRLKYESSKEDAFSATYASGLGTNYQGYQLALEYKPNKADNMRFHTAFYQKERSTFANGVQIIQTILVGTRINADFLK